MKSKTFTRKINTKLLISVILVLLVSCSRSTPNQQLHVIDGFTMGTYYRISIVAGPTIEMEQLKQQIEAALQAVNQSMSTYLETSEVSRFNRAKAGESMELSEPLASVIQKAIAIKELSQGAFDITVGPLVRLWGFGANGSIEFMPDEQALSKLIEARGHIAIKLNGRKIEKKHTATEIDLSAIAKGFAIDQVAELLSQQGLSHWLVDVGGELRAAGKNRERPWQVAIESPSATGGIQQLVELKDQAIATSGDYRNFVMIEGKAYSHAIDPVTGYPIKHSLASVSVLHESAETADALATALLVLGEKKALKLAKEQNLSVFLIIREKDNDGFNITKTGEFTSTSH